MIDQEVVDKYTEYYFELHPRAHVPPIKHPYHESINTWMIMKRAAMNALKQKWKDFVKWVIEQQGYANLRIEKCELQSKVYYETNRRHDVDNTVPKFIIDALVEAGMIVDDDCKHLTKLVLECFPADEHPRTELYIIATEKKDEESIN